MKDKTYDFLKSVAQIWLPAIATFYVTIASLWNLPFPQEISGTIMAIDTLLGVILGISTKKYNESKVDW